MLLDHGVDPAVVDREGRTLLHLAAKRIATLSITPRDVDRSNSLLICTQLVLESLRLKYAAPALREILDTVDAEGQAALHVAAAVPDQLMSLRLVRLLLYYSATPTKLSGTGLTAEMIARHAYNVETMNLLRNAAGANSQLSSEQLMPTPSEFESIRVWQQQHNAGADAADAPSQTLSTLELEQRHQILAALSTLEQRQQQQQLQHLQHLQQQQQQHERQLQEQQLQQLQQRQQRQQRLQQLQQLQRQQEQLNWQHQHQPPLQPPPPPPPPPLQPQQHSAPPSPPLPPQQLQRLQEQLQWQQQQHHHHYQQQQHSAPPSPPPQWPGARAQNPIVSPRGPGGLPALPPQHSNQQQPQCAQPRGH